MYLHLPATYAYAYTNSNPGTQTYTYSAGSSFACTAALAELVSSVASSNR